MLTTGEISESRIGLYLTSLQSRFPGTVVVDMFCYLRLHTELALRAKGIQVGFGGFQFFAGEYFRIHEPHSPISNSLEEIVRRARLPFADLTLFLLVTVVIGLYVRAGRRLALDRLLAGSLVLFGGVALLLAFLARGVPAAWVFPVVYVWVGLYGVLAPAQVWTLRP